MNPSVTNHGLYPKKEKKRGTNHALLHTTTYRIRIDSIIHYTIRTLPQEHDKTTPKSQEKKQTPPKPDTEKTFKTLPLNYFVGEIIHLFISPRLASRALSTRVQKNGSSRELTVSIHPPAPAFAIPPLQTLRRRAAAGRRRRRGGNRLGGEKQVGVLHDCHS